MDENRTRRISPAALRRRLVTRSRLSASILGSRTFLLVALAGGLGLTLVFTVGDLKAQIALIGGVVALLLAAVVDMVERLELRISSVEQLGDRLASRPQLRAFFDETIDYLEEAFSCNDLIFQEEFGRGLDQFSNLLATEWREYHVSYLEEFWRAPYQKLLEADDVTEYLSIAWVKSNKYWSDIAGRNSLKTNYDLAKSRKKEIRRIFIVRDTCWDDPVVQALIQEHSDNGIIVDLVKESDVPKELRVDLGIYGSRAVGYQHTDDESEKTQRFDLFFRSAKIDEARNVFIKLLAYRQG